VPALQFPPPARLRPPRRWESATVAAEACSTAAREAALTPSPEAAETKRPPAIAPTTRRRRPRAVRRHRRGHRRPHHAEGGDVGRDLRRAPRPPWGVHAGCGTAAGVAYVVAADVGRAVAAAAVRFGTPAGATSGVARETRRRTSSEVTPSCTRQSPTSRRKSLRDPPVARWVPRSLLNFDLATTATMQQPRWRDSSSSAERPTSCLCWRPHRLCRLSPTDAGRLVSRHRVAVVGGRMADARWPGVGTV